MATNIEHEVLPPSVQHLWHQAQVSHRDIPSPRAILAAIHDGRSDARHALGLAVQEASEHELVDLMIDKVLNGAELHDLLVGLSRTGYIRRDDLVEWSGMFE